MMIEQYASVRATPELVGRQNILRDIQEAISAESPVPHVFYITALGGWGKTRLLEAVLKKLRDGEKAGEWASSDLISASRLVDLYHTYTHNEEGLIADIVQVLDHQHSRFGRYFEQHAELDRVKYDLSQIMRAVTQQRANMMNAFIDDFNALGEKYRKIILAFDTVENLVYETDRVQSALGLADEPIGVAGWLVRGFLPIIHNAVVLIAGRPESPQLKDELDKLQESGRIKLALITLSTFSKTEAMAYFDAVIEVSRVENPEIAERLEKVPEEARQTIFHLSEGQPFLLSLFVDYLAVTDELLPILRNSLESVEQIILESGLEPQRTEFRAAIIKSFQGLRRPLDEVIRALAWTPKGMSGELLAWLLKKDKPTEDEIQQARQYIQMLRDPKFRLSFVKIRDVDNLVFLQDEMYSLMHTVYRRGRHKYNQRQTYELIVRFYEKKIKEQANIVKELQETTNKLVSSGAWKEFTEPQRAQLVTEHQNLRSARTRLQNYQVEHVYYSLQASVIEGIKAYSRVAEEAFQGNDINLWLLLRDELLKFTKLRRAEVNEIDALKYIDGDIGVRWIKNNIASGQYDKAQQQIEQFRSKCPDLLEEGTFADLSLRIWQSWALIYSGKGFREAETILQGVFSSLDDLADQFEPEFDDWRRKLLMAYAQDITGYLYRSQGNFEKAVEYYRKNIPVWRDLRVESEHANTLNNLSWSLAEIGEFQAAIRYCEGGLFLHRKLGRLYPEALSLNTLGIIEMRAGQPEKARFRCEQALGIFRDLEQPRGIGLACTALAESLRRMTNISDLLTDEQSLKHLELAEQYAKEAVGIFSDTVKEPLRLVEAYIELGCIYREIARRMKLDSRVTKELVAKGKVAFDAAVRHSGTEFAYRSVDALVNLAWMYYYTNDFEKAQRVIEDLNIDDHYLFTQEHAPLEPDNFVPWFWVQLGKANLLLGKMAFDRYVQANTNGHIEEAKLQLEKVGHDWTLSMAYNAKYSKNFIDVVEDYKIVYECLLTLNPEEMQWIGEGINAVYNNYMYTGSLAVFESFLRERFGAL